VKHASRGLNAARAALAGRRYAACRGCWLVAVAAVLSCGCAGPNLNAARDDIFLGRFDAALALLEDLPVSHPDRALHLMERGMAAQLSGAHTNAVRDWLRALDTIEALDTYSLSRGAASLAFNDSVQGFRGWPYERTLLHAFAAKSFLALGMWDDAAVEARRQIARRNTDHLRAFPPDPYSIYLSGVCFELIGDTQNAALEYRIAARLLPDLGIDPATGRFGSAVTPTAPDGELICFVGLGRAPRWAPPGAPQGRSGFEPYVTFHADGAPLGRSRTFAATPDLLAATYARLALLKGVKTVSRIALKELAAQAVAEEDRFLGELTRLLLFATETPDNRHWETLPRFLQVARVPCPRDLTRYEAAFHAPTGAVLERRTLTQPLVRRGNLAVSFIRDIPPAPRAGHIRNNL
jgi:tetratricopeptide (TPR) repeat protein